MTVDWVGLGYATYTIIGVAYVTHVSLERTKVKNWHMVVALSIFLPISAACFLIYESILAVPNIIKWLGDDA